MIELSFQGILWAFWNASRLGLLIHDAERNNGNTNIRVYRIMQNSPTARAGNHKTLRHAARPIIAALSGGATGPGVGGLTGAWVGPGVPE
jgi:hypothetical protein